MSRWVTHRGFVGVWQLLRSHGTEQPASGYGGIDVETFGTLAAIAVAKADADAVRLANATPVPVGLWPGAACRWYSRVRECPDLLGRVSRLAGWPGQTAPRRRWCANVLNRRALYTVHQ